MRSFPRILSYYWCKITTHNIEWKHLIKHHPHTKPIYQLWSATFVWNMLPTFQLGPHIRLERLWCIVSCDYSISLPQDNLNNYLQQSWLLAGLRASLSGPCFTRKLPANKSLTDPLQSEAENPRPSNFNSRMETGSRHSAPLLFCSYCSQ